jgi:hypothetical protein
MAALAGSGENGAARNQRDMITGILDSMMICRVAPPKIIWRMRLCV